MYDSNQAHYIAVTGILVHEGKYLIVKRAMHEKAFPGKWTVPGGKMTVLDYALRKKDTNEHWYAIFEEVLRREVKEEVFLEISDIGYVTNMIYVRSDGIPCVILSFYATPKTETVRLCSALTEYVWVTLEEAKQYDLIEGIYNEIEMLDCFLKTGKSMVWKKI